MRTKTKTASIGRLAPYATPPPSRRHWPGELPETPSPPDLITLYRLGHNLGQTQRQTVFGCNFDDSVRLPAQGKRIFRARRLQAQGEHAGDGIGLVGHGDHRAFQGARHGAFRRLRLVVIVNGVCATVRSQSPCACA